MSMHRTSGSILATSQNYYLVEGFVFSICGSFHPPQINLWGLSKPPQLESPQAIREGFG